MHRKRHEEERPEVVEHLSEEVPPEAGVWRHVWQSESCAPCTRNPAQITDNESGDADECKEIDSVAEEDGNRPHEWCTEGLGMREARLGRGYQQHGDDR